MALTFETLDVAGADKEAILVEGVAGEDTSKVIFRDFLSPSDEAIFELIDASEGATFKAKFEAYELENGRIASDVYGHLVRVFGDFVMAVRLMTVGGISAPQVIALQDNITSLEADVAALEAQVVGLGVTPVTQA